MDQSKLVARREELGLTQAEVAERAKMSQQSYARIESGKRTDPTMSTAERIADALNTTLDALRHKERQRRSGRIFKSKKAATVKNAKSPRPPVR